MAQTGYQTGYYDTYNVIPMNGLELSSGGGATGIVNFSISQVLNLSLSDAIAAPINNSDSGTEINTALANTRLVRRFKNTAKLSNENFNINQALDIVFNTGKDISAVTTKQCELRRDSRDIETFTASFFTNGTDGKIQVTIPSGHLSNRNMVKFILDDWSSIFYKFGAQ